MKKKYIVILISAFILLAGCSKEKIKSKSVADYQKAKGIPVRVESVSKRSLNQYTEYDGTLEGEVHTKVNGLLSDNIAKISVKVGDKVKKGDIIAEFETDSPSAQYRQTKLAFEMAEKSYNRMKKVFEAGGISQQDLDNVETQYKVAKENLNSVSQMVKVEAPISGTVTCVPVDKGDKVNPGDTICEIVATKRLKITINIDETDYFKFKKGQKATIEWDAVPDTQVEAVVSDVSISADPATRGFQVEVVVDNSLDVLKPGAFVKVKVKTISHDDIFVINKFNIIEKKGKKYVFILKGDTVKMREVETGIEVGQDVEIISGLHENDKLVVDGMTKLSNESKVNVINNNS